MVRLDVRAGLVYYGGHERLDGISVDDLYRFAEAALSRAVRKNVCFEISSEEAFARMQRDWQTNHELDKALHDHEITLDYQPKYRLEDGELVGAEAIVRWRKGGQIIPATGLHAGAQRNTALGPDALQPAPRHSRDGQLQHFSAHRHQR